MILKNSSLNCICNDPTACPNGKEWYLRKDSGCTKKKTVSGNIPEMLEKIEEEVKFNSLMYAVLEPAKKAIKGISRTESLFLDSGDRQEQLTAKEGTKNDPKHIRRILQAQEDTRIIDRFLNLSPDERQAPLNVVDFIYNRIPVASKLTINNRFLNIEYKQASIRARLYPEPLTVEKALLNLKAL